jgi:putative oxidoreductase
MCAGEFSMAALMLARVLSYILAVVFMGSSFPKFRRPRSFALVVIDYQLIPPAWSLWFARGLPYVELTIGLLLVTGLVVAVASLLALALLVSFVIAVSVNLRRGRDLDCGCLGGRSRKIGRAVLIEDLLLGAAAGVTAVVAFAWGLEAPWFVDLGGRILPVPAAGFAIAACILMSVIVGTVITALSRESTTLGRRVVMRVPEMTGSKGGR